MPSRYLPGEHARRERAPGREPEPDVFVEPRVLELDAPARQQVVLRLLHHRLVQVMLVGDLPRGADLVGRPLRRAPVERLAARHDVGHRPHRLFDRRVRDRRGGRTTGRRSRGRAARASRRSPASGTCGSACSSCWDVVDAPEDLGGDHVGVPLPAELGDRLAHDPLRLAARVRLGVVEEVDAGVVARPAGSPSLRRRRSARRTTPTNRTTTRSLATRSARDAGTPCSCGIPPGSSFRGSLQLRHVLVEIEVVAPGGDLAVAAPRTCPSPAARSSPFGSWNTSTRSVSTVSPSATMLTHAELDAFDRRQEHVEQSEDRFATDRGIDGDVVVHGVVGEVVDELGRASRPCRTRRRTRWTRSQLRRQSCAGTLYPERAVCTSRQ